MFDIEINTTHTLAELRAYESYCNYSEILGCVNNTALESFKDSVEAFWTMIKNAFIGIIRAIGRFFFNFFDSGRERILHIEAINKINSEVPKWKGSFDSSFRKLMSTVIKTDEDKVAIRDIRLTIQKIKNSSIELEKDIEDTIINKSNKKYYKVMKRNDVFNLEGLANYFKDSIDKFKGLVISNKGMSSRAQRMYEQQVIEIIDMLTSISSSIMTCINNSRYEQRNGINTSDDTEYEVEIEI